MYINKKNIDCQQNSVKKISVNNITKKTSSRRDIMSKSFSLKNFLKGALKSFIFYESCHSSFTELYYSWPANFCVISILLRIFLKSISIEIINIILCSYLTKISLYYFLFCFALLCNNCKLIATWEFGKHMTDCERICGTLVYNLRNRKCERGT